MINQNLYEYYEYLKDPIKVYFREKIQMIYSNKNINDLLETQIKTKEDKVRPKMTVFAPLPNLDDERGPTQSITTHKELRLKKYDLDSKMKSENEDDKNSLIKNLMDQHENINKVIKNHYQKEIMSQEDEFNRKMNERRERSLERSLVKGGSKRELMKSERDTAKCNTGLDELLGKESRKLEKGERGA